MAPPQRRRVRRRGVRRIWRHVQAAPRRRGRHAAFRRAAAAPHAHVAIHVDALHVIAHGVVGVRQRVVAPQQQLAPRHRLCQHRCACRGGKRHHVCLPGIHGAVPADCHARHRLGARVVHHLHAVAALGGGLGQPRLRGAQQDDNVPHARQRPVRPAAAHGQHRAMRPRGGVHDERPQRFQAAARQQQAHTQIHAHEHAVRHALPRVVISGGGLGGSLAGRLAGWRRQRAVCAVAPQPVAIQQRRTGGRRQGNAQGGSDGHAAADAGRQVTGAAAGVNGDGTLGHLPRRRQPLLLRRQHAGVQLALRRHHERKRLASRQQLRRGRLHDHVVGGQRAGRRHARLHPRVLVALVRVGGLHHARPQRLIRLDAHEGEADAPLQRVQRVRHIAQGSGHGGGGLAAGAKSGSRHRGGSSKHGVRPLGTLAAAGRQHAVAHQAHVAKQHGNGGEEGGQDGVRARQEVQLRRPQHDGVITVLVGGHGGGPVLDLHQPVHQVAGAGAGAAVGVMPPPQRQRDAPRLRRQHLGPEACRVQRLPLLQ